MQRIIKFFILTFILYLLVIGINYTMSKYVVSSSYDINVIISIDTQASEINLIEDEGININSESVTSNAIINESDLEENASIQVIH